jgi:hypothetical protein
MPVLALPGRLRKYLTESEQGGGAGGEGSTGSGSVAGSGSGRLLEEWDGLEALAAGEEGDGWGDEGEEQEGSSSQGEQAVVWSSSGGRR